MGKIIRRAGLAALLALAGCSAAPPPHIPSVTSPPAEMPPVTVTGTPGPTALPDAAQITPICTSLENQFAAILTQAQNGSVTLGLLESNNQYLAYFGSHGPKHLRAFLRSQEPEALGAEEAFRQGGAAAAWQYLSAGSGATGNDPCTGYGYDPQPPGGEVPP